MSTPINIIYNTYTFFKEPQLSTRTRNNYPADPSFIGPDICFCSKILT